jgi:anti-sigma regulatory factor (Ser/Thr protein kinase)
MIREPLEVDLPRAPTCAATARRWIERTLSTRLGPQAMGDLKLLVTELVDNAYKHGRGQIRLRIVPLADRIRIEVIDEGQGAAIKIRENGPERGGWGLRLVDGLALAWGAYEGTTHVWVDLPIKRPE